MAGTAAGDEDAEPEAALAGTEAGRAEMPNRRAVGQPRTGRAGHRQDSYGSDERSFPLIVIAPVYPGG